jgi:osmotically-inducible protein OsmY
MGGTRDIREAVEAELRFGPLADRSDITVWNGNGAAALKGRVPGYLQDLEAAAAAQRVAGVREVHPHLEVVLPAGDCRDDAVLTTAASNALSVNVTVPGGIEAAACDGNLTLAGRGCGARRGAVAQAVAGLTGVRNVRDEVEFWIDADRADVILVVQDALDRSAVVAEEGDVAVDTDGNAVRLAGHVCTWAGRGAVIGAAWRASGVMDVRDDLLVTG